MIEIEWLKNNRNNKVKVKLECKERVYRNYVALHLGLTDL